jgi:hypothetical protein
MPSLQSEPAGFHIKGRSTPRLVHLNERPFTAVRARKQTGRFPPRYPRNPLSTVHEGPSRVRGLPGDGPRQEFAFRWLGSVPTAS